MPSPTEISVTQLARRIGLPDAPTLIDVCIDDDFNADARFIPGAHRRDFRCVQTWAAEYRGKSVVVYCHKGLKLSQGVVAWLRHHGIDAQSLEGGVVAWRAASLPMTKAGEMPPLDAAGRTVWVTRARENRSHRLSLAHSSICRPWCGFLVRQFIGGDQRR